MNSKEYTALSKLIRLLSTKAQLYIASNRSNFSRCLRSLKCVWQFSMLHELRKKNV